MPRALRDDDRRLPCERLFFFDHRLDGTQRPSVTKAMKDVNYSTNMKLATRVLFDLEEELCETCKGRTVHAGIPCQTCYATGVK